MTGLLISSCSKEPGEQGNSLEETALITELLCAHYSSDCDFKIEASSVILEDDMVFAKEELLSSLDTPEEEAVKYLAPDGSKYLVGDSEIELRNRIKDRRRYVSQHEARDITYFIRPSLKDAGGTCPDGWEQAVREAAQAYNNLAGVKLNFREIGAITDPSSERPDITIGCDDDPYFDTTEDDRNKFYDIDKAGLARFCTGDRKPGKYISINNTSTVTRKTGLMIHEFGHTIGFTHTNTGNGVLVKCGDRSGYTNDPDNSVFRSLINRNSLHSTDKKSIRHLWPENLDQPINGSVERSGNDWVRFKFKNPSDSSKPYTEIVLAHSVNGSWEVARFWCDAPNSIGEYDIRWWAPGYFASGNQHFWVKGVSHSEEEGSPWCSLGGFSI